MSSLNKNVTAIAISGGIDSLVSAYLLKEQGHKVLGIHFITGYEVSDTQIQSPSCLKARNGKAGPDNSASSLHSISRVTDQLGIPLEIIDVSTEFTEEVVQYFVRTYQEGKTPNPCLVCNPSIKFGLLLDRAMVLGANRLATGHYARITKDNRGLLHLKKGLDPAKDQSYFLAFMPQEKLAKACFPLGEMKKTDVRKLAAEKGLKPVKETESQDVCFIREKGYAEFLDQQDGFISEPGIIEDIESKAIGKHRGLHHFTIGQRRGINCPASEPYYVVRMDRKGNRLVVGFKKDLLVHECHVVDINWISEKPIMPVRVHTQVRYRHQAVLSELIAGETGSVRVRFDTPQSAPAPGQGAVFNQGDEVLGGGIIQ